MEKYRKHQSMCFSVVGNNQTDTGMVLKKVLLDKTMNTAFF
jgi:hypothetical protein